jgi:hypothetical protein
MDANSATKKPMGIVEPLPSLLWKIAFDPQTEAIATAIHIAQIASDAHISRARSSMVQPRSETVPVGGCEIVDISTSFLDITVNREETASIGGNADTECGLSAVVGERRR